MTRAMFGRSTLTATGVPSGSSAKCTCATDALATGARSNDLKTCVDRLAVDARQRRDHLFGRERRHAVLQLGELVGDVERQQVAPRREHLAELDEDRPQLLQGEAQAPARAARRCRART